MRNAHGQIVVQEKQIEIEVSGRDLLDLEKAASDLGMTPDALFAAASHEVIQATFKIKPKTPAVVLPFTKRLTAL